VRATRLDELDVCRDSERCIHACLAMTVPEPASTYLMR